MATPPPLIDEVRAQFKELYQGEPDVLAWAPGRVELLGNHTDYNGGLVLATAIDRHVVVAARALSGRVARVHSAQFPGESVFLLDALERGEPGSWGRYVRGICWALQERYGSIQAGFEAAIASDVPLGTGLSSSAALETALAMALLESGLVPDMDHLVAVDEADDQGRMDLAQTLRKAENQFVGVASGLLDQFSCLFGRLDHAVWLDCRSLESKRVPLGTPAPAIAVCDSRTSRKLADGMYNQRRQECERVVAYFRDLRGADAVQTLRDLTLEDLQEHWDKLDPVGRRRARHVITENERVRQGAILLERGDLAGFGHLMLASHASSRDDFENSSEALDALIDAGQAAPGFLGGKLSGAGWAGCTVNLVTAEQTDAFADAVRSAYSMRMNLMPEIHICRAAQGATAISTP